MARAKGELHRLKNPALMQFLQNIITSATGNANAPTPTPSLAALQTLYDDGLEKINAVVAAETQASMLRAEREEHVVLIKDALTTFIAYAEAATGRDPVKLQSLGLPLRNSPSAPLLCGTVVGLMTSVGDNEGELAAKWDDQVQADSFEVQVSPDPITSGSWAHADTVSEAEAVLTGLPSGNKRWVRVRAVNRRGKGAWSDPSCRMIP